MAADVLIVESDPEQRMSLSGACRAASHATLEAGSGAEALDMVRRDAPALVLLDTRLPDISGLEVCRQLRRDRFTGQVLVIAGPDLVDVVVSLELGADDCVRRPYHVVEVIARIGARLRRSLLCEQPSPQPLQVLHHGEMTIDCHDRRLTVRGTEVSLRAMEFHLLAQLAVRQGMVMTRDELRRSVPGSLPETQLRTIDSHIYRLRHKLLAADPDTQYIETVQGSGYRFLDCTGPPGGAPPAAGNGCRAPEGGLGGGAELRAAPRPA